MSDRPNGVSLREYVEVLFKERQAQWDQTIKAESEARRLAAAEINARLERLNELRSEVIEDRSSYVTKEKLESELATMRAERTALVGTNDARIKSLEGWKNRAIGFGSAAVLIGGFLGGIVGRKLGL